MSAEPELTERQQALVDAMTFRLHFGPPLSEADGYMLACAARAVGLDVNGTRHAT